jgi:hypothetical protein
MNVGVFLPQDNDEHAQALLALATGIYAGDEHPVTVHQLNHTRDDGGYVDCDVAVVFGVGKPSVPASFPRGRVIDVHQSKGRAVLVLEKGFIRRSRYYMAGWNGINGAADFGVRLGDALSSDRWDALDVPLKPLEAPDEIRRILLVGQVPWDASLAGVDHVGWLKQTHAQAVGRRLEVRFRPHPLAPKAAYGDLQHIAVTGTSLDEDLAWADQVVTWNSNTAVDAHIAGKQVAVLGRYSMAEAVCGRRLGQPSDTRFMRAAWTRWISHTQWTCAEMREGLPWEQLIRSR